METSTVFGQEYGYFRGMSNLSGNSVLTPQAIPKKKKNKNWIKTTLDALEQEGLRQYITNLPMSDYYKMISGEMAYIDLLDEDKDMLYSYVEDFKEDKLNIPSYLKHWDLMYPIVSKIVGEWAMQHDKLRFDTTDEVSTNEYIRERTIRLEKYSEALFKREMDKVLLQNGIDIEEDFKSEEEFQEYQAAQNKIIEDYFPEKIDQDLKKNFKTEAAQWAQKTWARDYERFRMSILESVEARDILLVGKSARRYKVGYDYYFPEYWHPIEVFHSKEASITRMEDAEFAGRIKWYTVTELINNYGDRLSEKQRKSIYKAYFGDTYDEFSSSTSSYQNTALLGEGHFQEMMVPFKGYSDHKLSLEFEQATGIPLSEKTDLATGNVTPSFSMPLNSTVVGHGSYLSKQLRHDFTIRTDTIQTTEVYWKGSKKIGMLTYRSENGIPITIEVDEDLLGEVMSQYSIKTIRNISVHEFNILSDEDKLNTVIWMDAPIVYEGIKIRVSGVGIEDDIYIANELPFQIRGEKGNVFDVKLPVCGHIGDSYCKKIRPYQITFNYFMNQNQSYLQKEIGSFFVIDVNSIPTDYFNLEEGDDALIGVRNLAKTIGLLPTDFSRNNLNQNGGLNFNPMVYQNASHTEQINRNIALADRYKWMAYETLGLTPTSMGSPSQYATKEGIQVGQKAYFAQTYNIEQTLMENKRANVEVHMTVAQYCQLNNKDANYLYMASNDELEFLHSIQDEDFALRKIDVRSTYDPKKNSLFQELKMALIQNNTMGSDAYAMTELFMSDDFMELKEAAKRARLYIERQSKAKIEGDKSISDSENQVKTQIHNDKISVEREKIQGGIKEAELAALGRTGNNMKDPSAYQMIQDAAEQSLKEQQQLDSSNQEWVKIKSDLMKASAKIENEALKLKLEKEKIDNEREKYKTMKYVADAKNRDSIINKN